MKPTKIKYIPVKNYFYFNLFGVLLIAALGIIIYSNTFHCPFQFDDKPSIVDNAFIRNMSDLQRIWNFLPRRFILYLSLAFNYHLGGLDVLGYHLFNLAIHLMSAVVVWWLVLLTFATPVMKEHKIAQHANLIALLTGLVFVSHPVQTEAVTYIVQRTASMAALFYVASLCCYIQSRLLEKKGPAKSYYAASLMLAIVAMFTKETAITLPFAILLYEFSFFGFKKSFRWGYFSPFLLTILIIPLTIILTESPEAQHMRGVVAEGPTHISSMQYLLTEFRVVMTYIRLAFLPIHQNLDYDYPISNSIFEASTLISFLCLIMIIAGAKKLFSTHRLLSFAILWFLLTLLPESSLLPIKDVIFEHRLYLPMVGYSLFVVVSVYYLLGRHSMNKMVMVLALIIACNAVLTYQRNKAWSDALTLWTDTVQKSPHKARPYNNRGRSYDEQGNFIQAISDYSKAIEIDPLYADAYYNRGMINYNQGALKQAMPDFIKTIDIDPTRAKAYNSRGNVYYKQNDLPRAIADYNKAIEISPSYAEAYNDRGVIEGQRNDFAASITDFTKAIKLNPLYVEAYNNRGITYYRQSKLTEALADFTRALEIDPSSGLAAHNRVVVTNTLQQERQK